MYVAIGVDLTGERDVLGLWLGPTGGEGAKQWATMLSELRNRGLADALIVCCDGLRGLPEAIRLTWPQATVQTCVVHLVRNSIRYVAQKHWGPVTKAMREIYTAPTVETAQAQFEAFAADWEPTYPAMIRAWENAWEEFTPFLAFPPELRQVVYTTNAIESLNARFRRAVRHRGHFPNEQAAMKVLYLVATTKRKRRPNLTGKTNGWKTILNALTMHYGDRIADHIR
ncbi:MAG: IS256 family transposase [Acidimicrobiaceae bacterium]|nr:IS256 family transposase [Acidimicrobiaceae bacterium]